MVGLIKSRSYEICHSCIQNSEKSFASGLYEQHFEISEPHCPTTDLPGSQWALTRPEPDMLLDKSKIFSKFWLIVRVLVVNPKSATDIYYFQFGIP